MNPKIKKSIYWVLLIVLLIISALYIWIYWTPISPQKEKLGTIFPIPIALVNGKPVFMSEYTYRINVAKTTLGSINDLEKNQILEQLLADAKTNTVAERYGVYITNKDLSQELDLAKFSDPDFNQKIKSAGITEGDFKDKILRPEVLHNHLLAWFNDQRSLNINQYSLAESLKQQILQASTSSSTINSLVQKYSLDNNSKMFKGDLGFVDINSLVPELKEPLDSAKAGDIVIASSRFGIHIFLVKARDKNGPGNSPRIELKQILLPTSDFNSWYKDQIDKVKLKRLIL